MICKISVASEKVFYSLYQSTEYSDSASSLQVVFAYPNEIQTQYAWILYTLFEKLFQGPINQMILDKTNAEDPKFVPWTFQGHFRVASACSHGLDIH